MIVRNKTKSTKKTKTSRTAAKGKVKKTPSQGKAVAGKTKKGPKRPKAIPQEKLRVIVLGGLEEVGRNMTLLEYNGEIMVIDIGLQFPEEDMPGIDYIIPDTTYLEDKKDWVKGVVITHGHMDHIGGVPHVIGKIGNPPIYTGKLTAGLVKKRCEEHRKCPKLNITEINENSKIKIGKNFKIEFLRVNQFPEHPVLLENTQQATITHLKTDISKTNFPFLFQKRKER